MDPVSMLKIAQRSISRSFGVYDSPTIDTVKEKSIASYFVSQGEYLLELSVDF